MPPAGKVPHAVRPHLTHLVVLLHEPLGHRAAGRGENGINAVFIKPVNDPSQPAEMILALRRFQLRPGKNSQGNAVYMGLLHQPDVFLQHPGAVQPLIRIVVSSVQKMRVIFNRSFHSLPAFPVCSLIRSFFLSAACHGFVKDTLQHIAHQRTFPVRAGLHLRLRRVHRKADARRPQHADIVSAVPEAQHLLQRKSLLLRQPGERASLIHAPAGKIQPASAAVCDAQDARIPFLKPAFPPFRDPLRPVKGHLDDRLRNMLKRLIDSDRIFYLFFQERHEIRVRGKYTGGSRAGKQDPRAVRLLRVFDQRKYQASVDLPLTEHLASLRDQRPVFTDIADLLRHGAEKPSQVPVLPSARRDKRDSLFLQGTDQRKINIVHLLRPVLQYCPVKIAGNHPYFHDLSSLSAGASPFRPPSSVSFSSALFYYKMPFLHSAFKNFTFPPLFLNGSGRTPFRTRFLPVRFRTVCAVNAQTWLNGSRPLTFLQKILAFVWKACYNTIRRFGQDRDRSIVQR